MDHTLSTLTLLEARLARIEYLLYGHTTTSRKMSALQSMQELERRLANLLQRYRVYAELLHIYNRHRSLFDAPPAASPDAPTQLPTSALAQIVMASSPAYHHTSSSLTSIMDTPIPDASQSAALASLLPRLRGVETTQLAQAAEIAELRVRSEALVLQWYEKHIMAYSGFVADVDGRVQRAERHARRVERLRDEL